MRMSTIDQWLRTNWENHDVINMIQVFAFFTRLFCELFTFMCFILLCKACKDRIKFEKK